MANKIIKIRCPICGAQLDLDDILFYEGDIDEANVAGCSSCMSSADGPFYYQARVEDWVCDIPFLSIEDN